MRTELDYWRELTAAGSVIRYTPDEVLWEGTVPAGANSTALNWRRDQEVRIGWSGWTNGLTPGDTLRLVRVRRATKPSGTTEDGV